METPVFPEARELFPPTARLARRLHSVIGIAVTPTRSVSEDDSIREVHSEFWGDCRFQ